MLDGRRGAALLRPARADGAIVAPAANPLRWGRPEVAGADLRRKGQQLLAKARTTMDIDLAGRLQAIRPPELPG